MLRLEIRNAILGKSINSFLSPGLLLPLGDEKNVKLVSELQNEQVNDILYNMRTRLVVELKMAGGVFFMKLASLD